MMLYTASVVEENRETSVHRHLMTSTSAALITQLTDCKLTENEPPSPTTLIIIIKSKDTEHSHSPGKW